MRVLQITAFSGWGCTGRIALGIHNELVLQGHESMIAWGRTNTAPNTVPTIKIGTSMDQKIHGLYTRITDKCGFGSKKATEDFIKKVDFYKPDLIQLHILHGYYINLEVLFNYIKLRNIPVVWTFHDCWAFTGHCPYFDLAGCDKWKTGCHDCQQKKHHPTSWIFDNSKWNWNKKRQLFTGIRNMTIVTPSKWLAGLVKQSFLEGYDVEVINNGINIDVFKPTQSNFREKNNLQGKKIVLGVSSTWANSKGLKDFIELAKILPKEYQVVLVGLNKKQKQSLPKLLIGIEKTDSTQELAALYSTADVFVNPTYEDNYPTTNLEALSCGTPVVTYKTGGSIEAVQESGVGAVVTQGNVEELCQAVKEVCRNSRPRIIYECSEESANKKYLDLYNRILWENIG